MAITVLVPDKHGISALADTPGVRPLRYEVGASLPDGAEHAEVLVPTFLSGEEAAALFAELPNLRLVQLLSAGAERWIGHVPDGVLLSTCRGAHGGSTAEWVMATLLSIYRELPAFERNRAEHHWDQHRTDTLQDKRVLVVGAGDLGGQLARRMAPFDATVTLVGTTAREGVHGVDQLPCLLGEHDVTVLMVPMTERTRKLADARFLAAMPDGAVLVNAARGPVVDTDALLAELRSGRLRAALDVTDPEPLPVEHPLWEAPGLLLTPHVGGSCRGLNGRAWSVAAGEIARFAVGERPRNVVRGDY